MTVGESITLTDSNRLATIKDIPKGTTVTITEVTAPNDNFNKREIKKIVIKPNETIGVTLNNKEQLGQVFLAKTGKEFGTTMFNQYYSLKGAVYEIYKEDGLIGEVPKRLQMYLDYSAIGRDLEINGNFLVTSHAVFEYKG